MKICLISHSSRKGGAELVLLETISILKKEGIECSVLLPEQGELCEELTRLEVRFSIIPYPLWVSRRKFSFSESLKTTINIAIKTFYVSWKIFYWKCDLVYTNTITVCVGALASRILGLPHVWHLHEFGKDDHGLSFLYGESLSLKLIDKLSSRCICVSKTLKDKYKQYIDLSKIKVLYPPMNSVLEGETDVDHQDTAIFPRSARFRCAIVGALTEGKSQGDAVLAIALLKRIQINVELVIVGGGNQDYRRHLEAIVLAHGLGKQVTFSGQVDNVLPAMRASNAILVCSKKEAFGRVTIESMLVGRPVIGANSGATTELIQDGINGLLYSFGDPNDLANKIKFLYENRVVAEEFGENGQAWAKKYFTADRYRKELLPLLSSMIKKI